MGTTVYRVLTAASSLKKQNIIKFSESDKTVELSFGGQSAANTNDKKKHQLQDKTYYNKSQPEKTEAAKPNHNNNKNNKNIVNYFQMARKGENNKKHNKTKHDKTNQINDSTDSLFVRTVLLGVFFFSLVPFRSANIA